MTGAQVAARIKRHGIVIPTIAVSEAKRTGLDVAVGCAFLMRESGGGHNIFGHDPTIYCGAGTVTKDKYLAYKRARGHSRMQGVGPMQLTWYSYQDAADRLGGCWQPKYNVREGFSIIEGYIRKYGLWTGAHNYNGSGPAAVAYANAIVYATHTWRAIIGGARASSLIAAADAAEAELPVLYNTPVGVPQSYLPKVYCWNAWSLQCATSKRNEIDAFMHAHPYLYVYSALRQSQTTAESDHHCGYATDLVPRTQDAKGKAALVAAQKDAKKLGVPYTELEWKATNKHLHVSWARCPL